jgi:hypothetical protein
LTRFLETVFPGIHRRWMTAAYAILIFLSILAVQMLGFPQLITGTMVNAGLLLAAVICGPAYALGIGISTPAVALARGILPAVLAPMIPFIAISNGVLVLCFYGLYKVFSHFRKVDMNTFQRGKMDLLSGSLGLVISALVKFLVLSMAVSLVSVPAPIAVMMQWPQLITALLGGMCVLGLRRI